MQVDSKPNQNRQEAANRRGRLSLVLSIISLIILVIVSNLLTYTDISPDWFYVAIITAFVGFVLGVRSLWELTGPNETSRHRIWAELGTIIAIIVMVSSFIIPGTIIVGKIKRERKIELERRKENRPPGAMLSPGLSSPGGFLTGALTGSGHRDFHHPALPAKTAH